MKSTGIVRRIDNLGRIVVPKEIRSILEIECQDPIEMYIEKEKIILQKYEPRNVCLITREVNQNNRKFADGKITLSKHGAEILKKQLDDYFNQCGDTKN